MASSSHRNRLATESSAYLLQHVANPVDWYPWGEEALQRARSLDRPILLSIGYSACHWCHVMERESFENPDIAAVMNAHFVCIKVDREERPDVDHLYMKALQGMTGRGGWPMTMFLTPHAKPFYAGTYFPPEDRSGMPGFPRVLLGVSKSWTEKREEVLGSAERMVDYLSEDRPSNAGATVSSDTGLSDTALNETVMGEVAQTLAAPMDAEYGGFGRAPKFPGTMALSLMMELDIFNSNAGRLDLVRLSLDRMAAGGIRDHLGGGFHRYSTDREWLVPHFEKMLYDQALLVRLYSDAALFFREPRYANVAEEILDYLVREMTSSQGGFFSAQDADSQGEEGRFFVWSSDEIAEVLGEVRALAFCRAYGVTAAGNFEGQSILQRVPLSDESAIDESDLAECRRLLLERRATRIAPDTDRKVVTDWNGLTISAMALAGDRLHRDDLVDAAARAADFVLNALLDSGKLQHVHAGGVAKVPGFLDDYAFFGRACLDLFSVRPQQAYFEAAKSCADTLLEEFLDEDRGGFYFTGSQGEGLIARTSDLHDGAVPAGNSVAAELLLRLWALTGEDRYRRAGQGVLDRFLADAIRHPYGGSHLLAVALRQRLGWRTVAISGDLESSKGLSRIARETYDPRSMVVVCEPVERPWYPASLQGKSAPPSGAWAYVCEGSTCSLPIRTAEELGALLRQQGQSSPAAAEDAE